jgi:hypothetical protein
MNGNLNFGISLNNHFVSSVAIEKQLIIHYFLNIHYRGKYIILNVVMIYLRQGIREKNELGTHMNVHNEYSDRTILISTSSNVQIT